MSNGLLDEAGHGDLPDLLCGARCSPGCTVVVLVALEVASLAQWGTKRSSPLLLGAA